MKSDFLGTVVFGFVLLIGLAVITAFVILGIIAVKALIRYTKSKDVRKEKSDIKKSLGEVLKQHREECKMTQEFVAEAIGVSRQAVSKWETGKCMPDYSVVKNLCEELGITVAELMDGEATDEKSVRTYDDEQIMDLLRRTQELEKQKNILR